MAYKDKDKQIEMQNKWLAKNVDRITLAVPKGKKAIIKEFAESRGLKLTTFINEAIDEKMERDK